MARNFVNAYERIKDVKVSGVVSDILKLYLCYEMLDCSAALLEVISN